MTVPFFDYTHVFRRDKQRYLAEIERVCDKGAFILQEEVQRFEDDLAAFLGVRHAIGVSNATDGLLLILLALGLPRNAEVIVPSHTFVASAAAVHFAGLVPVLCDVGPDHMISAPDAENRVTSKTRAIMPVHLNGRSCDMNAISTLAQQHDLEIVEDAAQALGARCGERLAGTFGRAASFSFYPAKTLGALGDGGAVVTDDDSLAISIRELRDHGRDPSGVVRRWGLNCRLDNVQAAILTLKLQQFGEDISRRRAIANQYQAGLSDLDTLTLPPGPGEDPDRFDTYQNYEVEAQDRDELKSFLARRGIGTIVQWGGSGVHQLGALGLEAQLPTVERLMSNSLLLPMNVSLQDYQVDLVCSAIRDFYQ